MRNGGGKTFKRVKAAEQRIALAAFLAIKQWLDSQPHCLKTPWNPMILYHDGMTMMRKIYLVLKPAKTSVTNTVGSKLAFKHPDNDALADGMELSMCPEKWNICQQWLLPT